MMTAEHFLVYLEPLLILVALIVFLCKGYGKRLPAMRNYLVFRTAITFVLEAALNIRAVLSVSALTAQYVYFYAYWISYLAGAVLVFLVLKEIYSELMRPIPGLQRLGGVAFQWIAIVSGIIAFAITVSGAFSPVHGFNARLVEISQLGMHAICVLELCMLAFLALTVHNLGRSYRSIIFGIGLGLGLNAAGGFLMGTVNSWQRAQVWSDANFVIESITISVILIWTTYFFLPESASVPSVEFVPSPSPLIRWNDVAQALGHGSPRVASGGSTGFFLQDVERVVDRVLARNHVPEADTSTKAG